MLTSIEATSIMTEVDGLQSIYICEGANAFSAGAFKDAQVSSLENGPRDFDHEERVNVTELSKYAVFYLTALPLRMLPTSSNRLHGVPPRRSFRDITARWSFTLLFIRIQMHFPQSNQIKGGLFTGILLSGQTVRGKQPSNVITVITLLH